MPHGWKITGGRPTESLLAGWQSDFGSSSKPELEGLLTFRSGQVIFDDFERLVDLADFDTAYLDQEGPLLR